MIVSVSPVVVSRTLTSAWIETTWNIYIYIYIYVALSRVRGLKLYICSLYYFFLLSHSHECVD